MPNSEQSDSRIAPALPATLFLFEKHEPSVLSRDGMFRRKEALESDGTVLLRIKAEFGLCRLDRGAETAIVILFRSEGLVVAEFSEA